MRLETRLPDGTKFREGWSLGTRLHLYCISLLTMCASEYACVSYSCVVCMSDFANEETIKTLPCNHEFHSQCIDPWLSVSIPPLLLPTLSPLCSSFLLLPSSLSPSLSLSLPLSPFSLSLSPSLSLSLPSLSLPLFLSPSLSLSHSLSPTLSLPLSLSPTLSPSLPLIQVSLSLYSPTRPVQFVVLP